MGFVDKETGNWNQHQWNWPEVTTITAGPRAFHIETKEDQERKRYGQSQAALTNSPYTTPEQKSGNQSKLRSGSLYSQPKPKPDIVHTKKYTQLKFCEANMVKYLNSLRLGLFNKDNPVLQSYFDQVPNLTDEQLTSIYNILIDSYNKKSFDPVNATFVDGNGQDYTHKFKTINDSKSSPVLPGQADFVSLYRATGAPALYAELMAKRGFNV